MSERAAARPASDQRLVASDIGGDLGASRGDATTDTAVADALTQPECQNVAMQRPIRQNRNAEAGFMDERRLNATHLCKTGHGAGPVRMAHRAGLVVQDDLSRA